MKTNVSKLFKKMVVAVCVPAVMLASGMSFNGCSHGSQKGVATAIDYQREMKLVGSNLFGGVPVYLFQSDITGDYVLARVYSRGSGVVSLSGKNGCNTWSARYSGGRLWGVRLCRCTDENFSGDRLRAEMIASAVAARSYAEASPPIFPGSAIGRGWLNRMRNNCGATWSW